nr:DUF4349 domain-containing protein [Maliibacterium massiliense]
MKKHTLKKLALLAAIALVMALWVGCAAQNKSATDAAMPQASSAASSEASMGGASAMEKGEAANADMAAGAGAQARANAQEKIIRTYYYELRAQDVKGASARIESLVTQSGGYVLSSNMEAIGEEAQGRFYANLTVRVPQNQATAFKEQLGKLGEVLSSSNAAEDVTDQYYDLEARLKAAQAEEAQLMELLKNCTSVEDTLKVREQLSQVRGEIESMQGQLKRLGELTQYDTYNISLSPPNIMVRTDDNGRIISAEEFSNGLSKGFQNSINVIVNGGAYLLIGLANIALPLLLVAAIVLAIIWIVRRAARRSRAKKLAASQAVQGQDDVGPQQ